MTISNATTELTTQEALNFLGAQKLGRMAMTLAGDPEIVPVNFVLHTGSGDLGTIYIHTAAGNKLFAAAVGRTLAFEVDDVGPTDAASVIAYGNGRIVQTSEETELAHGLGLEGWVANHKSAIVAIDISRISGRSFRFGPDPANPHMEVPG